MGQSHFSVNYFAALLKINQQTLLQRVRGRWPLLQCSHLWHCWPPSSGGQQCHNAAGTEGVSNVTFQQPPNVQCLRYKNTTVCSCTSSRVTLTVINNNNTFRFAPVKKSGWWLEGGIKWSSFQFFQKNLTGSQNLSQKHPNTSRLWEDGGGASFFSFAVGWKERLWLVAVNPRVRDN